MKKITLLSFFILLASSLFSQEIQFDKIKSKKDKSKLPTDFILGFGATLNPKNESIGGFGLPTVTGEQQNALFYDTNNLNIQVAASVGIRKRISKFRIGISTQYAFLTNSYNDYLQDIESAYGGSYDVIFFDSERREKFSTLFLNFGFDFILLEKEKSSISMGLNSGIIYTNFGINDNCNYYITFPFGLTSYESQFSENKFNNRSFLLTPNISYEYELSSKIKLQLSLYYLLSFKRGINQNSKAYRSYYETVGSDPYGTDNFNYENSIPYNNRSRFGSNLSLIFPL